MLGNDVVDLADPETRRAALHPRFDARAFAPRERAALAAASDRQRAPLGALGGEGGGLQGRAPPRRAPCASIARAFAVERRRRLA